MSDDLTEAPNNDTPSPFASNPDAALATALAHADKTDRIAARITKLEVSAYALIGLALLAIIQSLVMNMVFVSVFGTQSRSFFGDSIAVAGATAAIIICTILLTTRRTDVAKTCLLIIGTIFTISAISNVLYFDIVGSALDGIIAWMTYNFYQSVCSLEIAVR